LPPHLSSASQIARHFTSSKGRIIPSGRRLVFNKVIQAPPIAKCAICLAVPTLSGDSLSRTGPKYSTFRCNELSVTIGSGMRRTPGRLPTYWQENELLKDLNRWKRRHGAWSDQRRCVPLRSQNGPACGVHSCSGLRTPPRCSDPSRLILESSQRISSSRSFLNSYSATASLVRPFSSLQ
jgi:hypothetical protein